MTLAGLAAPVVGTDTGWSRARPVSQSHVQPLELYVSLDSPD